jgi:uncharacterized membrane protein
MMIKERTFNNFQSFFIFLLFLAVVLSAIFAPIIQKIYGYPTGEQIYSFFWHICHQYPTRSFSVLQYPFALCSRCTGGYTGVSLAAFIFYYGIFSENDKLKQIMKQRFFFGTLFLLIGVLDGLCQALGFYDSGNLARFFSGLTGGFGVFFLLYPGKLNSIKFYLRST